MAHELETFDNGQTAFASARLSAWHQLGTVTQATMSAHEIMGAALLGNWGVRTIPVRGIDVVDGIEVPILADDRRMTVRRNPVTGTTEYLGIVGLLTDLLTAFCLVESPLRLRCVGEPVGDDVDILRDLGTLRVARMGSVVATGDRWMPVVLRDPLGDLVEPVSVFLRDVAAQGRSVLTLRSYGMDLLRWFRFLWAVGVVWDRATRSEARDFSCWLTLVARPGKSVGYAPTTRAHAETVLRHFYDLHRELGTGPIINPFPLARSARTARPNAHHNPMEPFKRERLGAFRPTVPRQAPRNIPDEAFDRLFAALRSHRDRALVALWVSTGARASELLGIRQGDVDPGQQLITVVRKGTQAAQTLPASPDAFVWLRLYQAQMKGKVPVGRRQPVWWTLRAPLHPLAYHGAHRMFERANALLGLEWTLHDLRHTAAHRMVRDPAMPLVDVQWILGHAHLSTTQLYISPTTEEVITSVRAHHERRAQNPTAPPPAEGYRQDSLDVLFGGTR